MLIRFTILTLSLLISLNNFANKEYFFWEYTAQNGLISSNINCITQDENGFLWIGTNLGVSKFDGTSFQNFNVFDNLSNNEVKKILQLPNGKLLIIHVNGVLTLYDNKTFTANYLNLKQVKHFAQDNMLTTLLATDSELLFLQKNKVKKLQVFNNKNEFITSVNKLNGDTVLIGSNKRVFKALSNNGELKIIKEVNLPSQHVVLFNNQLIAFKKNTIEILNSQLNSEKRIVTNFEAKHIYNTKNELLISTINGIYVYENSSIHLAVTSENGLPENNVNSIYKDHEGTLWAGLNEKGLVGLPSDYFPKITYDKAYGKIVSRTTVDNTNYLIFENAIIKQTEAEVKQVVYRSNKRQLTAYTKTSQGENWIGTSKGLFITFPGTFVEYEFKELRGEYILQLKKLSNGSFLIVTKKSVYVYNPSSNRVDSILDDLIEKKLKKITAAINIKDTLYIIGKGNILKQNKLNFSPLFNWDDNKIKDIEFNFISKHKNLFWVATQGKGIIKYSSANQYSFYTEVKKIPFKYIVSCKQHNNNLWVASNKGILKLNLKNNGYTLYNQRHFSSLDVLPSVTFPQNKAYFYFLAKEGLIKVDTERYNSTQPPSLRLTELSISGRTIHLDSIIKLQYGKYPITIKYNALSLSDKVYFQYRLNNFQDNWSQPTTQKMVEFIDLPPNSYTFEVRQVNPITNWTGKSKKVSFIINIPFWKTNTFYILIAISFSFLVLLIYVVRIFRLKIQTRKLETQVERKTFQIAVQKKHLEQLSYSLSHDLKNPVNNIKGLVEILEDTRTDDIIKMLEDSTNILETKILSTLSSIKKAQANVKEISEVDFKTVLNRVEKSLLMLIKKNNASINANLKYPTIFYEASLLESIMYNLISNAIKYRHPDREPIIEVSTTNKGDYTILTVTDNGLGLDLEKDKDAIFSIFKRVHKNAEGTGIGLYMIKQMVEINGGKIEVESKPQVGTSFHVYLKDLKEK